MSQFVISPINLPQSRLKIVGFLGGAVLVISYAVLNTNLTLIVWLTLFIALILFAYTCPVAALFVYLLVSVWPLIFLFAPFFKETYGYIGSGLYAVDIMLVAMAAALIIALVKKRIEKRSSISLISLFPSLLLFIWFFYEVLRNVRAYGLSAPGEFRFQYLILVLPYYIYIMIDASERRRKLFRWLLISTIILPLISIPILGALKNWQIGSESRFFPASISLGLLLGNAALYIGRKYKLINVTPIYIWLSMALSIVLILLDSHRSVWISAIALVGIAVVIQEVKISPSSLGFFLVLLICITWLSSSRSGQNIFLNLKDRANEVIFLSSNPSSTANWRLQQWDIQIATFKTSMALGEGFGRYWGSNWQHGDIGVQPHNYYIQTLVKTGIVGLSLYAIIFIQILFGFGNIFRKYKGIAIPDISLVIIGFLVLISSHVYYVAYSLDAYSLMFIGLGASALRDLNKNEI